MSNTQKVKKKAAPKASPTYKFAEMRAEAQAMAIVEPTGLPESPPFVIDDVVPPIVITAPDTLERQLVIAELIDAGGDFTVGQCLPLLRALCGDAFPRVWQLIRNDKDSNTAIALVQALVGHHYPAFEGEASEIPGGSPGSSD
jgi:hypothetical protein